MQQCRPKHVDWLEAHPQESQPAHLSARAAGPRRKWIEVRAGVVQNPKILSFQGRASDLPHPRLWALSRTSVGGHPVAVVAELLRVERARPPAP